MLVSSIGNVDNTITFNSRREIENASTIVNLDDSQLRLLANVKAIDKEESKKHKNSVVNFFYAMPIVDTIARGILAESSPLSKRLGAMGRTASVWGAILGVSSVYGAAKKSLVSNSPTLQKFEKNNPVASFIADVGMIMGGVTLTSLGLGKLVEKTLSKKPELVEKLGQHVQDVAKVIDNSKCNTKYLSKITEFAGRVAEKAPWLAKTSKFALRNSLWILAGMALYKTISYSDKKQKQVEKNYQELKQEQNNVAKFLVNESNIERDVLSQEQELLVSDLRKSLNRGASASQRKYKDACLSGDCEPATKSQYQPQQSQVEVIEIITGKNSEQINPFIE
jgi:hypothetical protein